MGNMEELGRKDYYEQEGFAVTCRSYEEYVRMFDVVLTPEDEVLDVAGGASSFGAAARLEGIRVVSADPQYAIPADEMQRTAIRELEEAEAKIAGLRHKFDWSYYGTPEEHERQRRESVRLFLDDYAAQSGSGVYVPARLPQLPFEDNRFSHVFCSHFLFLYAEQLPFEFHLEALLELSRVVRPGGEVRVYPLMDLKQRPYERLEELLEKLRNAGLEPRLSASRLPFIPGSVHLLAIAKPQQETIATP